MSISLSCKSPLRLAARFFLGCITAVFLLLGVLVLAGCGDRAAKAVTLESLQPGERELVAWADQQLASSAATTTTVEDSIAEESAALGRRIEQAEDPSQDFALALASAQHDLQSILAQHQLKLSTDALARLLAQLAHLYVTAELPPHPRLLVHETGRSLAHSSGQILPTVQECRRLQKLADSYVFPRVYIAIGVADPQPFSQQSTERQEILAQARGERLLQELGLPGVAITHIQTQDELSRHGPQRGVILYALVLAANPNQD
jgi:hypothetical protein